MIGLLQALGNGILIGLVYALLGLCIVIIFKASEAFNFAIGEFLVIGSFLFYILFFDKNLSLSRALVLGILIFIFFSYVLIFDRNLHFIISLLIGLVAGFSTFYIIFYGLNLPSLLANPLLRFIVALPLGLAAAGMVGLIIERLTIKPLLGRNPISMTMVALGLIFFLRASVQLIFGSDTYSFFLDLPDITLERGDFLFLSDPTWAGILSIITFGLVIFFLFRTRWGLAIRAVSEDQAKAMAFGIDARFILLMIWAISAVCIAVAGIMISNFGALAFGSGIVGMRAIPVVLIGGMDSIGGALVGGIIIGVCEALAGAYIEPMGLIGFKDVAPYFLMLIVLFFRPYGLFGTVRIERV
ncbi:MAG: branched-chain amino acid ABC transporter permease [Deltaproteobacteria bacterium]|nr:branched-chain amino acid ABC transporter permease [Deltaproteobacteria bacterium]MBW2085679.1 branched-chain amino acid ABC transporter permease [Deltaproteobacteria bacterium]